MPVRLPARPSWPGIRPSPKHTSTFSGFPVGHHHRRVTMSVDAISIRVRNSQFRTCNFHSVRVVRNPGVVIPIRNLSLHRERRGEGRGFNRPNKPPPTRSCSLKSQFFSSSSNDTYFQRSAAGREAWQIYYRTAFLSSLWKKRGWNVWRRQWCFLQSVEKVVI